MHEYPKALYGPKGWDDLDDCVTVHGPEEEAGARARGYRMLGEAAEAAQEAPVSPFEAEVDIPEPQPFEAPEPEPEPEPEPTAADEIADVVRELDDIGAELGDMKKDALMTMASELGIAVSTRDTKADLVNAIQKAMA